MLKTGITQGAQLDRVADCFKARRRVSYALCAYRATDDPREAERFEKVIRCVRLRSGVYRTTHAGRFTTLDAHLRAVLRDAAPTAAPLRVHDWGVSDALTTLELKRALAPDFPGLEVTASDLTLCLVRAAAPSGREWILEPDGGALQYVRPPFVLSLTEPEPWYRPVNRLLRARGLREAARIGGLVAGLGWDPLPRGTPVTREGLTFSKIPLVHPRVLAAVRAGEMALAVHDAFQALPAPVDVVRTMNIYNLAYFSEARIAEGIAAVADSLREGGVWVVGRSTGRPGEGPMDATVYARTGDGFRPLLRLGAGTEVDPLVPQAPQARQAPRAGARQATP
jgi:hypothetical protein